MRSPLLLTLLAALFFSAPSPAADKPDVQTELKNLVAKVQAKLAAGQRSAEDLAAELGDFDGILARHRAEKSDAVAEVLLMKAMLYVQVLDDDAKGTALLEKLKKDFPGTKPAAAADKIIASIAQQAAAKKIQATLKVGAPFPDFQEKDLDGKPLSISALKGKVVLVDFWATWCGPCVAELPNVLAAYEKYHDKGFAIVGISLDQDKSALTSFLAEHKMTWPQYFDGQGWQNKLAQKYGISSIPATFLLDKNGRILAKGLRGEALGEAVAKALGGN